MRRLTILLAVAVSAALLGACGGDDEDAASGLSGSSQEAEFQDAEAKAAARTAVTAMETYYVDNLTYAGATTDVLAQIEPALPVDRLTTEPSKDSYAITAASESGNSFTITKEAGGAGLVSTCETAGEGGCPESGNW